MREQCGIVIEGNICNGALCGLYASERVHWLGIPEFYGSQGREFSIIN